METSDRAISRVKVRMCACVYCTHSDGKRGSCNSNNTNKKFIRKKKVKEEIAYTHTNARPAALFLSAHLYISTFGYLCTAATVCVCACVCP